MIRVCFSLVSLALVGLQLAIAHEEHMQVANSQVTIEDICANKQVPIISIPEVRRLINDFKAKPSVCRQNYAQSFYQLELILTLEPLETLCGDRKFKEILDYHFTYVNPKVEDYKFGDDLNNLGEKIIRRPLDESKIDYTVQLDKFKQEVMIPISLQQFFKAWALQVSGICKQMLVANVEKATRSLTDADMDMLEMAAKQEVNITDTPVKIDELKFGDLVYLPELEGEIQPGDAEARKSATVLDLRSQPEVNRLMHACKRRFKPIYDKLIMPIERLSKLGYEYVGTEIDKIRDSLEKGTQVRRWIAMTVICEAQGNFELVEDPNSKIDMEELDYTPVVSYKIDGTLWIKGPEALSGEFDKLSGYKATGLKKFLFNTGVAGRKVIATIDPHQFAWYRRNQNTLSSGLNIASILSNVAGMFVTFMMG